MRRRVAIAAVVLAGALATWWWWSPPEAAPAEAAGAGGPGAPPKSRVPPTQGMVVHATVGARAGQSGAVFTGRVSSSEDGSPVPRATVTFSLDGAHDAVTDEAGAFRFEAPRPGTYELRRVAAEGFAPYEVDVLRGPLRFVARPGAAVDGIELELMPLVRCTGIVRRAGEPVPGVSVECVHGGDEPISGSTTDAEGAFTILCARSYTLHVDLPGFILRNFERVPSGAECRWEAEVPVEDEEIEAIFPVRTLDVRVVDVRGRPVPQAIVSCFSLKPDKSSRAGDRALYHADESGVARCEVMEGRDAIASLPGVPGSERSAPPDASELTLEAPSPGRLRGRVRDFNGEPVPVFRIIASDGEERSHRRPFISTDGTFDLGELLPGKYEVRAESPGFPSSDGVVADVSPEATAEVTLTLPEGLTVRGVVLDAVTHRPIAGARVASPEVDRLAWPMAEHRAFTVTDLNGRFAMSRLALPASESLMVSASGYLSWELDLQEVLRGDVTVELTPTSADAGTEYGGVGLAWRALLVVDRLVPGGPAERAGVVIGDRLIRIDGAPVPDDTDLVGGRIRGSPGTLVELGFDRQDGGEIDVSLRRERIPNPW